MKEVKERDTVKKTGLEEMEKWRNETCQGIEWGLGVRYLWQDPGGDACAVPYWANPLNRVDLRAPLPFRTKRPQRHMLSHVCHVITRGRCV
jgi:hypothetical protein